MGARFERLRILGRVTHRAWAAEDIAWGIFNVPEQQVGVLGEVRGLDVLQRCTVTIPYRRVPTMLRNLDRVVVGGLTVARISRARLVLDSAAFRAAARTVHGGRRQHIPSLIRAVAGSSRTDPANLPNGCCLGFGQCSGSGGARGMPRRTRPGCDTQRYRSSIRKRH